MAFKYKPTIRVGVSTTRHKCVSIWGDKMFSKQSVFAGLFVVLSVFSAEARTRSQGFPLKPDSQVTPGDLCQRPTARRYPEGINYCERDVESETKRMVIEVYQSKLGYNIMGNGRANFKIDHYIPLCMGGSNEPKNLWPQHKSVYMQTDPLEPLLCEKMASGSLRQQDAVKLIIRAKNDFSQIPAVMKYVSGLR